LKLQEQPAEYRVDHPGDVIINRTDWRGITMVVLRRSQQSQHGKRTFAPLTIRSAAAAYQLELCHSRIRKYSIRVHLFSISLHIF